MQTWEQDLLRWQKAGVLDATTAERIRAFEAADARPAGWRWQVLVALVMGAVLLGAGILLLVAAHWDEFSPGGRLMLVVLLLAALHAGAIFAKERFPGLATALHGVGTIAAGGAIATVGQIFNMQAHWPAAVMLWMLCAAAGWYWLRDQFQQTCTMLLLPAWVISEWEFRAEVYAHAEVYLLRMVAVLAAVYLTGFLHSHRHAMSGVLFGVSGVALVIALGVLAEEGWQGDWMQRPVVPHRLAWLALGFMAVILIAAWWVGRESVVPTVLVLAVSYVLPWLRVKASHGNDFVGTYGVEQPSVWAYLLLAGVAAFLAWWGVRERSRVLVNYGVGAFALTVAWFYFSSLMDKLGRSLGLIGLGLLFLLGGWLLERVRRRLVADLGEPDVVGAPA